MPGHKRRLSANLLGGNPAETAPVSAGQGGAWRAGITANAQQDLDEFRARQIQDVLTGAQSILLDPDQIIDKVGTDRRPDWQDQPDYIDLRESIEKYGQDTPIEVWPVEPDWRPSSVEPTSVEGVQFELVTGRRRRAVAEELGLKVRAIIPPREHEPVAHRWQVLLRRYRENNHRSDLAPFEKMISIGEMYAVWKEPRQQASIRQFAAAVGIDPTFVSRCTRLFQDRDELSKQFPDPYRLTYRDLEAWIANQSAKASASNRVRSTPKKSTKIDVAGHSVELKQAGRRLILTISDVLEDPDPEQVRSLIEGLVRQLTNSHTDS